MNRPSPACIVSLGALLAACSPSPPDTGTGWISLFDGQSLDGWKASENVDSFSVEDGAIVCDGDRSHLFYMGHGEDAVFRNFELVAEVKTRPGANSGIYFDTAFQEEGWPRRGFEIQVNNSQKRHDDYLEMKKTGSLYGYRNVYKALVDDDEWFQVKAEVQGQRVRVWLDHTLVVDYREPEGLPTGESGFRTLDRGTFALQCHDPESQVFFRNLRVRPLPDDITEAGPAPPADETELRMLELGRDNFPLVDLHVHLKGDLTLDDALQLSRKTGMFFGIAVNVGKGFPIETDEGALAFLEGMRGQPVFIGMQGEGREWVDLISPEARARFDYVFTDSMTFTDDRTGLRTRLWIPDEVEVGDPQAFMDMLVAKTVGILENEPIDVYVNPTFLPDVIADDYDTLWTEERMQQVIDAAVAHDVAIEIGARYRLPSERFLRLAQEAGAKFTFGTNNTGAEDLGDWSYPLEMQQALELTWKDMYVPGHGPSKAQKAMMVQGD
jgi:hypothetical protein